jgi:glutamate racemase
MIGVFDSGVGGLTVLKALRSRMPRQDFTYVADTAHLPYGSKPFAAVRELASEIMNFFGELEVEGVVIACNTASAAVLPEAKLAWPFPLWGAIDATVEAATRATCGRRIGVIATEGTIASGIYQRKLAARGFRVWAHACPALVQAAEENSPCAEALARHYLRTMPRVDTLVLGCTHFALLRDVIAHIAGPRVLVVDGADELARTVASEIENEGAGRVDYYGTGITQASGLPLPPTGRLSLIQQSALPQIRGSIEIIEIQ